MKSPSWISWGPTSSDSPEAMGFLWDSLAVTQGMDADNIYQFDSRNWWNVTDKAENRGSVNNQVFPGSLLVLYP